MRMWYTAWRIGACRRRCVKIRQPAASLQHCALDADGPALRKKNIVGCARDASTYKRMSMFAAHVAEQHHVLQRVGRYGFALIISVILSPASDAAYRTCSVLLRAHQRISILAARRRALDDVTSKRAGINCRAARMVTVSLSISGTGGAAVVSAVGDYDGEAAAISML